MKWVTELKDKHKDKTIWIAGSDPTLSNYPDDFFDEKIGITLHLAYLKFPKATYRYFSELDRIKYLIQKDKTIKNKHNIFSFPFFNKKEYETWGMAGKNTYYHILKPYPPRRKAEDIFNKLGYNAMKDQVANALKGDIVFSSNGTCLHSALYIAILMGGNPINIIGCNHRTIDNKNHFVNEIDKEMRPTMPDFSEKSRSDRMILGTKAIIEGAEKYKIKINWHKWN